MRLGSAFALSLALSLGGCSAQRAPADDALAEEADDTGKADGEEKPVGAYAGYVDWTSWSGFEGEVAFIVLKTDGTYFIGIIPRCIEGPCDAREYYGAYKFTKAGSTRYLKLLKGKDGTTWRTYAWQLERREPEAPMQLKLRVKSESEWQGAYLLPEPRGLCRVVSDCEQQPAEHPDVPGAWSCNFYCGFTAEPAGDNTCVPAGGACVASDPYERVCPTGTTAADEGVFTCGAARQLTCCVPDVACTPTCGAVGTPDEGWYDGCTLDQLCPAHCGDAAAPTCGEIGTAVEGWYVGDDAAKCTDWDTRGGGRLFVARAACGA